MHLVYLVVFCSVFRAVSGCGWLVDVRHVYMRQSVEINPTEVLTLPSQPAHATHCVQGTAMGLTRRGYELSADGDRPFVLSRAFFAGARC